MEKEWSEVTARGVIRNVVVRTTRHGILLTMARSSQGQTSASLTRSCSYEVSLTVLARQLEERVPSTENGTR